MRRILALLLSLALVITVFPALPAKVSAAGPNNFTFFGEQYEPGNARITTDGRVTLQGTVNNVISGTISYSVFRITWDGTQETVIESNENQTGNIILEGNSITVHNIQLYPGLNRITFKGISGSTEVVDSIYIEYRDTPTLYNLKASLNGMQFNIEDNKTTVIYSNASRGLQAVDISISGNAPNADKVTVIVNNRSYTYSVSSSTNYTFVASPVNVTKGLNVVTIRVFNKTQVIETTRNIAFYNGEVTFYDVNVTNGASSVILDGSPNFNVGIGDNIAVKGKVIIPLRHEVDPATLLDVYRPDYNDLTDADSSGDGADLVYAFGESGAFNPAALNPISIVNLVTDPGSIGPGTPFIEATFEQQLGTVGTDLNFDKSYLLQFRGQNYVKTPPGPDSSNLFRFTLRNKNAAYIYQINYLPGYKPGATAAELQSLTGLDLQNQDIFSLPMGVEVLIGNPSALGAGPFDANPLVVLSAVREGATTYDPSTYAYAVINTNTTSLPAMYVTRTVDGVSQQFLRVFVEITKLPNASQKTLEFKMNPAYGAAVSSDVVTKTINLLYGPHVKYDRIVNNMQVEIDTTNSNEWEIVIKNKLGDFAGQIMNVSNPSEIRYETTDVDGDGIIEPDELQTVFLYLNNVEIPLQQKVGGAINEFVIREGSPDADTYRKLAYDVLYKAGDNTLRFVLRSTNNYYESTVKITLVPTNLPVIPAPNTSGVFPYSINRSRPMPNDPNFQLKGNIYTTKEAKMNIYGTFDFVDLGTNSADVNTKLDNDLKTDRKNYILRISSPGMNDIVWTLDNYFVGFENEDDTSADIFNKDSNGNTTQPVHDKLDVIYYYNTQTFAFILKDQELPEDGSSRVYTITVYNSGLAGPSARYRLEVDPVSIPYTILAPIPEKRVVNQDYVTFIITSPGADSVTVSGGKSKNVQARQFTYLDYNNIVSGNPTKIPAFIATVSGLSANKANKIDFVIRRGQDEIKDSITVTYVPENIPGASVMQKMSASHKVFDGALNLTFPRGTNLIRRDYNVPENLRGQVFEGHDIVFSIANPEDGVVDRHDFETVPANYDLDLAYGRVMFTASFPQRYVKVSPVFWIDAGQADDPDTPTTYDPIRQGTDPYPFSIEDGVQSEYFYTRDSNRELIPSNIGKLTLSFDPSMRQSASKLVTVFRYDPYAQQWENIGGVVDEKNNTITVPFTRFGYYVVAKLAYGFNDITGHPYGREALEAVFAKGVMNPVDPSGIFGTDIYVTRAEFARMIVRALELPLNYDGPNHFVDVPNTGNAINMEAIWDYRYVETAARAGFVRGTQPRVFEPDRPISRQEAAVMLANALNLKLSVNVESIRKSLQKAFKDEQFIDTYAKPAVEAVYKKGFITGSPIDPNDLSQGYVFEPQANLLRGDAAIIIARVMADQKKLPKLYIGPTN